MNDEKKQSETYRASVLSEDGTPGALVFTVKPGGNVHAEFEPASATGPTPVPEQLPAEPTETPAGEPPGPEQRPA